MTADTRTWVSDEVINLAQTISPLRRGKGDPALTIGRSAVWWCTLTPDGPGTIRVSVRARERAIDAQAWGAGTGWLLEQLPALVGGNDHPADFHPAEQRVAEAWRQHRHCRIGASGRVFESCAAAVLEQKVTGMEARRSWRALLRQFGTPAPGQGTIPEGMFVPPPPMVWAQIPDWDYHAVGVTPQRIRTLRAVSVAAAGLERIRLESTALVSTGLTATSQADRALQAIPGVGVWTSAEVRQRALGDADAVSFGDFHVAKDLCWWLTGETGDDEQMARLLRPYPGHRYRVQRLMELGGVRRPRRGPRFAPPAHRFA